MAEIEERVSTLESILGRFIIETRRSHRHVDRELLVLKEETLKFQKEMADFKDEMKDFKTEMLAFKDEMKDYKAENDRKIEEWRREAQEEYRRSNKQWGELANKMGTLVEDLIAPAIRPVLSKYFKCKILHVAQRVQRKSKNLKLQGEFDLIAASDNTVFLVEVRSSLRKSDCNDILDSAKKLRRLFPEYISHRLELILASLSANEKMINTASQQSIYLMTYREWDYMDILNFSQVKAIKTN